MLSAAAPVKRLKAGNELEPVRLPTRDTAYLILFLLIAFVLLILGRHAIAGSVVLSWGLTFAGTTTVAVLALSLYRYRLALQASRRELAMRQAELQFALKVQQSLLPQKLPTDGGLELSAVCLPARGVSGDYYDVMRLPDGRLVLAIADISGKGMSAAILMANLQALLRVIVAQGHPPDVLCSQLNHYLHDVTEGGRYATFFYAEWHPETHRLDYVNAGHNPPFRISGAGSELLHSGGIPLGIMAASSFEIGHVTLEAGDLLVLYSDGITEAGLKDGKEFGADRLAQIVRSSLNLPLPLIQKAVLDEVRRRSGEDLEDDLTLLLARAL